MGKEWCLEVWGDYACFTRPEMKVERVSYDVITPSAARAIFEAILWKPAIKWHITKIEVLNPIKWISIRRNEVEAIAKGNKIFIEDTRQQRAGLFLRDVKYRIYGYFESNESDSAKHAAMFERRAKNGQCFNQPYFGCREFVCYFKLIEKNDGTKPIELTQDMGFMLYDRIFDPADIDGVFSGNNKPEFFRANLKEGILVCDRKHKKIEVRS
jgi:CRISPR-associated protein Cas5d